MKEVESGLSDLIEKHFDKYLTAHKKDMESLQGIYSRVLDVVKEKLIEVTLRHTEGNQVRAAKILGINRNTVHRKVEHFKINEKF